MSPRESCDGWYERYHAYQLELGQYGRRSAWYAWISPVIGAKCWPDVTVADAEDVRDRLDEAIAARRTHGPGRGRLTGRSALDAWHVLTAAARAARRCKRRDLRALEGLPTPCADVEPPGDAVSRRARRKTFVYPSECARLLACRRVPRVWREVYAIAGYTYLRPGELRVLRWPDVDLSHRLVHVSKAFHYGTEEPKEPKTPAGIRDVPIPRALVPLLRRMREQARSSALVVPLLGDLHRVSVPIIFRRHLLVAGISRGALHESSHATVRANFRSWRDSGITWLALAGVDVARIARRAGHEDISTTMTYVKTVEDLRGTLGQPFGRLPSELVRGRRS